MAVWVMVVNIAERSRSMRTTSTVRTASSNALVMASLPVRMVTEGSLR